MSTGRGALGVKSRLCLGGGLTHTQNTHTPPFLPVVSAAEFEARRAEILSKAASEVVRAPDPPTFGELMAFSGPAPEIMNVSVVWVCVRGGGGGGECGEFPRCAPLFSPGERLLGLARGPAQRTVRDSALGS